jgi:glycosyltransferase involved in cell wall biosynthesis
VLDRTVRLPVSVVIPAYEAEHFLGAALESVAHQTAAPSEIIVVDDGSSDRTAELAAGYGVRVLAFDRNRGPAAARNAGVRIASQPWIAFLDADDRWHDAKTAVQWAALRRWPGAEASFCDYDVIRADGSIVCSEMSTDPGFARLGISQRWGKAGRVRSATISRALVRSMFVRQSSVMVKRDLFLDSGGFDERLRLAEDYEFFLRTGPSTRIVAIEESLVTYQRRAASLTADPLEEMGSIDALWEFMLARPDRYAPATLALVRAARAPALLRGALRTLRLGCFAEARPLADKACELAPSPAAFALFAAAFLLDNPAGENAHRVLRNAWRARPHRRSYPASAAPQI